MNSKIERYVKHSTGVLVAGMAWALLSVFGEIFLYLFSAIIEAVWNYPLFNNHLARILFMSYWELGSDFLSYTNPAYYCSMYSFVSAVQAMCLLPCSRDDKERIPGAEQYAIMAVLSTLFHAFFYLGPYFCDDHIFFYRQFMQ